MQGERLLSQLVENDVVDDSGAAPVLSDPFRDLVEDYESELALHEGEEKGLAEHVRDKAPELRIPSSSSTFDVDDVPYLAELLALCDRLAEAEAALQVLPTLDLFSENPPPLEGTPDLFVQVTASRLRTLVKLYERTIVYAWGYDCDPCDIVREDLDEIIDEPMEGIPLLAVCGEGCSRMLYEEFKLKGAPTVLFTIDGRVDLRLEGAQHFEVLEAEVERFPSVLSSDAASDLDEDSDAPDSAPDTADQET